MKRIFDNKKTKKGTDSAVRLTVYSFIRWNLICLGIIVAGYALSYIILSDNPTAVEDVYGFLNALLNREWADYILKNSILLVVPAFVVVFIVNCIIFSFSTLFNLGRVYKSIDAFVREGEQIRSFPKMYSGMEIKLRDVHLKVVENRRRAIEAEKKKDDLVMYLAHDLKTPLTSIIGYLTLLDESRELTVEQRAKFTGISLEKAYRLEQLINEFFEITRFSISRVILEKNRIDLNMLISQMLEEFYPMLSEKSLSAQTDIPEHIIMLGDADKLARVFDNLLKNAVSYSYEGTAIKIGARIRRDRVIIKIRNYCDEIPEEKLRRLFDKFYRLDSSRSTKTGGSGLGLAIVKQLVELHSGTIEARSSQEFTEFIIVLPFTDASALDDSQLIF